MNKIFRYFRVAILVIYVLSLGLVMTSCSIFGSSASQLRVTNAGTVPIQNLIVLFPEEKIEFGNIPPGGTTEFKRVAKGVYNYAAYSFDLDGINIGQPVIDWVGEKPLEGDAFTYVVDLDPNREQMLMLRLQEVRRDQ